MARFEEEILIKINVAKEQAKKAFADIKENAKEFAADVAKAAKIAAVALAGLSAAMFGIVVSTASAGDELAKMSKRINVSVADLSALKFQAQLAGTDFNTVANGIRFLTKAAFDSTQGLLTAKRGFDILGVSATDSNGKLKDATLLFNEVSGALSEMEDGTEKVAAVQLLFGSRMGTQLLPLLNQGSDALREQAEEARKLGIVYSDEAAAASEEFVDTQLRLKSAIDGIKKMIGLELMPVMNKYLLQVKDFILLHKIQIKEAILAVINVTKDMIVWVFKAVSATAEWIKENKDLLVSLGEFVILVGITSKMLSLVAALKLLGPAIVAVRTAIVGGGLMAGLATMGPLLTAIAAAAALVVGYKLGKHFLEWAKGTDKAEESTQKHTLALEANKQKLAEAAAVAERNRIAIAKNKQTWLEATQEVEKNTTAQKANIKEIGALIDAHEKAGQTVFESIEKQRQAALKLAGDLPQYKKAINEMFDEMRLQAAKEDFGILDVEEFDQQARNIVEGFKEITGGYDLTMGELEALTQKAFDQIKEAADSGELPIGFDINKIEENVNEAMAKLKDGMQKTTGGIVEEGNKITITLKGQTLTVKEAVANTITALNELLLTSVTEESRALSLREQAVDNYVLFVAGAEADITEFTRTEIQTRSQLVTNYADHSIAEFKRITAAFQTSQQINLAPLASPGEFTGYTGQFHQGTSFVPSTGNYLLEKGEAVIPANQNDNRSFDNSKSVEVVMNNNFYGDNGYDQANALRQMLATEGAL
jgi:hypothetical protein